MVPAGCRLAPRLLNQVLMRHFAMACLLLPVLSGCILLDGDDDDCDYGGDLRAGEADIAIPTPLLRNPDSGQCEDVPIDTGGGECDPCGRCAPTGDQQEPQAPPDWGECQNACSGLDEATCLATDACRAAYLTACVGGGCPDDGYDYYACWAVAPAGYTRGGTCEGLDAYECSRHDDCVARHARIVDCVDCTSDPTVGGFESCAAESEPAAACAELGEAECVAREDCDPYYDGVDCTCDGDTCTCADHVFTACE